MVVVRFLMDTRRTIAKGAPCIKEQGKRRYVCVAKNK